MSCVLYALRAGLKNSPARNGHSLICFYCCLSDCLIRLQPHYWCTEWGIQPAPVCFHRPIWQRREGKVEKVEGGRQEVGVISSGSYYGHFLCSLLFKKKGRKEEKARQKDDQHENKKKWNEIKLHQRMSDCVRLWLWELKRKLLHTWELKRKLLHSMSKTQWWANEEVGAHEKEREYESWPLFFFVLFFF